jgi:hypothetical protein
VGRVVGVAIEIDGTADRGRAKDSVPGHRSQDQTDRVLSQINVAIGSRRQAIHHHRNPTARQPKNADSPAAASHALSLNTSTRAHRCALDQPRPLADLRACDPCRCVQPLHFVAVAVLGADDPL